MFILLVAPPGYGKTAAIVMARNIAREHPSVKLTPNRITPEALYIEIENSVQSITNPDDPTNPIDAHTSLTAMIDEFSVFVKPGDFNFMASLADLFDCPDPFEYVTKSSGQNFANKSWFNMIGGCTPFTIRTTFEDKAIEMGFPARIILVYSEEEIIHEDIFGGKTDVFENPTDNPLFASLSEDFEQILLLQGPFIWAPEAASFLADWYRKKLIPYPKQPKLQHYCMRRLTHISKLAMIHSASRSNEMVITIEDIERAKHTLLEVEEAMPGAVAVLGENTYYAAQARLLKWMLMEYSDKKRAINEATCRRLLTKDVPPFMIDQMLDNMVAAKYLTTEGDNTKPHRNFIPHAPKRGEE
jgi:hypothetical protein